MLYPLKFTPILKETIWGGAKLRKLFGKSEGSAGRKIGESWELSAVKDNVSLISNGPLKGKSLQAILNEDGQAVLGKFLHGKFGNEFPLLIKFIDADDNLSVQVHPDDAIAKQKHNSFGKTEMWYILDNEPGAQLISGFKRALTKQDYKNSVADNTILSKLASYKIKPDDGFFIPAGRVHAIGKGIVLAEIQQTSNITYRIYDYDRKDAQGKARELHTELAAEAIDLKDTSGAPVKQTDKGGSVKEVCSCRYFTVNAYEVSKRLTRDYKKLDSFVVLICLSGSCDILYSGGSEHIKKGDTVLIPYSIKNNIELKGAAKILETYIPAP